jgi:tetratricopeptide (TPR) repeat protein
MNRLCRSTACVVVFAALFPLAGLGAEGAKAVTDFILYSESGTEGSISRIIDELGKAAAAAETAADKRSILVVLGSVQEHAGRYADASRSYATAAGIAAPSAEGMPRVPAEQLVIDAVRCSLSAGDYESAESYLDSAVKNSANPAIQAYIKLYTAWCLLSKAQADSDVAAAAALLEAYAKDPALETVRPQTLLTLWYIDPAGVWGKELARRYPDSPEAAIVQGKANIFPSPFWFFLPPRTAQPGGSTGETPAPSAEPQKLLQLGLFRNRGNADALVSRLKNAGFAARVITQNRGGQDYFVVVMNDSADTQRRLKDAGFDAFPLK